MHCGNCGLVIDPGVNYCPECGAQSTLATESRTPPSVPDTTKPELDYDVTGRRTGAAVVDLIPLSAVFFLMSSDGSLSGGPLFLFVLIALGYYIISEGFYGTTFGKKVMGLKVVRANGEPHEWNAALARNALRVIDGLPVLYLVGFVSIAVTPRRQRLGDLAARTLVVRANGRPT